GQWKVVSKGILLSCLRAEYFFCHFSSWRANGAATQNCRNQAQAYAAARPMPFLPWEFAASPCNRRHAICQQNVWNCELKMRSPTVVPNATGHEAAQTDPMVMFERVTKRFGNDEKSFAALDGVDLTVGRGEITGIIGRSGAGKSTL